MDLNFYEGVARSFKVPMHRPCLLLMSITITLSRMANLPGSDDSTVVFRDESIVSEKLQKFIQSGISNFQVSNS